MLSKKEINVHSSEYRSWISQETSGYGRPRKFSRTYQAYPTAECTFTNLYDIQIYLTSSPAHCHQWRRFHLHYYTRWFYFVWRYLHHNICISLQCNKFHLKLHIWITHQIKTTTSLSSKIDCSCFQFFLLHLWYNLYLFTWIDLYIVQLKYSLKLSTHDC